MTKNEALLITLIRNSSDPEKAMEVAISVITAFIKTINSKEVSK